MTDAGPSPDMPRHVDVHRLAVIPQVLAVSACLVTTTALAYAQAANPEAAAKSAAASQAATPTPAQPGAPAPGRSGGPGGGRGLGPIEPSGPPEGLDLYPDPPAAYNVAREDIPHGQVEIVEYDSKTLGLRRMLRVYTPPGYSTARKYPVLYLHHGLGNTSTEWTQRARAPIIIDNLLAEKKAAPFIIVFPSGNATATPADEKQGDRTQASYGTP